MPYDQTIIVPIVMGKEGVYGIRNADRVPMGGARLVRNVSLEGRTMRTEGGAASLGTAIGSAGRASLDYWRFYVSGSQQSVPTRLVKHSLSASQAARGEDQRGAADRRGPLDQDPRRADPSSIGAPRVGLVFPCQALWESSMRRFTAVSLLAVGFLLAARLPSEAWTGGGHHGGHHHFGGRSHVFVGVGPWFWGPPYPYWWDYPPAYYYAPPVVVQEPPVYIQQPAPTAPAPEAYWYYCASAQAYYPTAPSCPEQWIQVPARNR